MKSVVKLAVGRAGKCAYLDLLIEALFNVRGPVARDTSMLTR
jgi:hypothetical protein